MTTLRERVARAIQHQRQGGRKALESMATEDHRREADAAIDIVMAEAAKVVERYRRGCSDPLDADCAREIHEAILNLNKQ